MSPPVRQEDDLYFSPITDGQITRDITMHGMFICTNYCTSEGKNLILKFIVSKFFYFIFDQDIFLPLTNIVLLFFVKREVALCVKL